MKTGHPKSVTMKGNDKPATPYFSAYPLKAIKTSEATDPNKITASRLISRLRVLPMINPYREKVFGIKKLKQPDQIQPSDTSWFNSYE